MARPRKFYVIYRDGQAVTVAHGLVEATRLGRPPSGLGYNTQLEAEERAAWHNHEHTPWWLTPRDEPARPAATPA